MRKRVEDKIMEILYESPEWETVGGPTPSATLKGPLDYAKNVQKATVPQAYPVPGVGEIGSDEPSQDEPITNGFGLGEEEDEDKKGEDDNDKDDLEETFASLLSRLAEEDEENDDDEDDHGGKSDHDEDDEDDEDEDKHMDEEEGETSLDDKQADFGNPEETLPDVDSELDSPEKLVTKAPGIKVAESQKMKMMKMKKMKKMMEDEGETSLDDKQADFGNPEETLPDVDSMLDTPDKLTRPAVGAKAPNPSSGASDKVEEDINAIFAGTKLSEAAKAKATTIFRAAVTRRVNEEKQRVQKVATKKLKEAFAVLKARSEKKVAITEQKLTGQVDRYLNYVVENWMAENRLAVERGIRAELAEDFIKGLKNLFVEHYIEVPESKVDVLATLGKKVTTLESKLNEAVESNVKMRASLNAYRKEEVIRAVSSGLAETQREKLNKLAEGVEYTTRKEFATKLNTLKESYFPKRAASTKKEEVLMESAATNKPTVAPGSEMDVYTKTIAKMGKKD
jgi:hypothetical protein